MTKRGPGGRGGGKNSGNIPGNSALTKAVKQAGSFPKPQRWKPSKYPGLVSSQPGKKPSPNALRGKIGNDLARAAAARRGETVVASEVNIRKPGSGLKGSSNIDLVVRKPDGKLEGLEVKTGDGKLRPAQEEHYPKVPKGGLELGSDSLAPGLPKGRVLGAGQIPSMRVERWNIDSIPSDLQKKLEDHTVAGILRGDAGSAHRAALDKWMRSPGAVTTDHIWT